MRGYPARFAGPPDMTGQSPGGWLVLRRAANVNGNARWLCRHDCENPEERIFEGIQLRSKPNKYCKNCRQKRPGAVRRLTDVAARIQAQIHRDNANAEQD